MTEQENKNDPTTWPKLYSAADSRWQDAKRLTSWVLVFVIALAIIIFYLAIYTSIYPNQISNQGSLGFTGFFVELIKKLWVYILVLMITISVGLGLVFYSSGNFLRSLYNLPDSEKTLKRIIARLFGVPIPPLPPPFSNITIGRYPFVLINIVDVVANKFSLKDHPSYWLGGSALLIVLDGTGIYLQRGNCFSRTLGPGIYFLERFETVREIVDLRPQTMRSSNAGTPPPIAGRTKDGIKIIFNLEISFRVVPASNKKTERENGAKTKAERDAEEKYLIKTPINSGDLEAIRKAVESTSTRLRSPGEYSEAKWQDGVWGSVSGELAKYITKHYLDDLIIFENKDNGWTRTHQVGTNFKKNTGENITTISKAGQLFSESEQKKIKLDLDKSLQQTKGITLTHLRIIDFELPPEVYEQRLKMLEVKSKNQIKRIEGDATAKQIRIRENARTRAQQNLIANLAASLSEVDPDNFADAVMLSLSNVLSQKMEDTLNSTFFAKDTFDILNQLREFLSQED